MARQLKDKIKGDLQERIKTKKEEKALYKAEYQKARNQAIKEKAKIKASMITKQAREDAKAGGRGMRIAKNALKQLREHRKEKGKTADHLDISQGKDKRKGLDWL